MLSEKKKIIYGNDEQGNLKFMTYSELPVNSSFVIRTIDGRIKSNDAKEENDVVTLKDIC